jgi:hypothetical protein
MSSDSSSESKIPQIDITAAESEERKGAAPQAAEPVQTAASEAEATDQTEAAKREPEPLTPSIVERVSVPETPSRSDADDEGGEWEVLSTKVKEWIEDRDLADRLQRLRQPLLIAAGVVLFILVLRIYGGILAAIETVPLAPRIFELIGVTYATWFATTRLILSEERRKIGAELGDLWSSVRGGNSEQSS